MDKVNEVVEALLAAIAGEDDCFVGRKHSAGSVHEGSKIDSQDEFDFTIALDRFSEMCFAVINPSAPFGYVELHRKKASPTEGMKRTNHYFNESDVLDTRLVKLRFEVLLKQALSGDFDEKHGVIILNKAKYEFSPLSVGTNIKLRLTRPIGKINAFMPPSHVISIDLVPAIHVTKWFSNDALSGILADVQSDEERMLIFDQPQRKFPWTGWTQPHARLCFSLGESEVIRRSPAVVRACYIVVKQIAKNFGDYAIFKSYVLKSAVMHCVRDEINAGNYNALPINEVEKPQLLYFVQRVMKYLLCFVLQDYVPSVFKAQFQMPVCTFEPHFKFSHFRLHEQGLNYQDFVLENFFESEKYKGLRDGHVEMIAKTYLAVHLMYFCLLPEDASFDLCFPSVNPLKESRFSFTRQQSASHCF
jgi:hypothetical protein